MSVAVDGNGGDGDDGDVTVTMTKGRRMRGIFSSISHWPCIYVCSVPEGDACVTSRERKRDERSAAAVSKDSCHCQWVIRSVGQWNKPLSISILLSGFTNTDLYRRDCCCWCVCLLYLHVPSFRLLSRFPTSLSKILFPATLYFI